MTKLTTERLLEILHDREHCEFCPDCGDDAVCVKCEKVKGITVDELRAYYAELAELISAKQDGRVVVHGRWIEVSRISNSCETEIEEKCSNCGRYVNRYSTQPQDNYCPNCGARMEESHD